MITEDKNIRGQRVVLSARIETAGVTAHPGDQGTVTEVHVDGWFTLRMSNGRRQVARKGEFSHHL